VQSEFPIARFYAKIAALEIGMTRQQVLDLYFMDARAKLLDLAAFMDRVDRAEGEEDFRMKTFRQTLAVLDAKKNRAEKVLLSLSDPTKEPIPTATTKAASGAYPGTGTTGLSPGSNRSKTRRPRKPTT
jgi:hypothetical protein